MKITPITENVTSYEYELEDGGRCIFRVTSAGLITIIIESNQKKANKEEVAPLLNEITQLVLAEGKMPQINIAKDNHYLQQLAKRCHYKYVPAGKFSFNIWKYQS